nr:hypothetical protein [Nonomuraea typhae]
MIVIRPVEHVSQPCCLPLERKTRLPAHAADSPRQDHHISLLQLRRNQCSGLAQLLIIDLGPVQRECILCGDVEQIRDDQLVAADHREC